MAAARRFSAVCLAAAVLLLAGADKAAQRPPAPPQVTRGALIRLEGVLDPRNQAYLERKLAAAKEAGADLVIIEIDSPGGLKESSEQIAAWLRDLYWAHTVAYVPREAMSGAAVVALACDEIIVGPHALLGDVGVISLGQDQLFHYAPEKVVSPFAQWMRDLAKSKHRSPSLAEAMVDRKLTVYRVKNAQTGQMDYLSQREIDAAPGQWEKIAAVPQSGGKGNYKFLTFIGKDAVDVGLAAATAESRAEVIARWPGAGNLLVMEPGFLDTTVLILNSPWITGLLLVVGLVGLYIEFCSPGIGIGGLLAALCFAIFFWSHFLGGTADWLAAVLFLLGVAFLAVELFILPGFAVAGLVGAALLIASLVLAIQGFFIPHSPQELNTLTETMLVIICSGLAFAVAAVVISRRMGSLPLFRHLMLPPPEPATAAAGAAGDAASAAASGAAPAEHEGPEIAVGRRGLAQTDLRPGGKARFGNRFLDVVTDGSFIPAGSRIEVVEVTGNRVVVGEGRD